MYAALIRSSQTWRRVVISEFELKQIEELRNDLDKEFKRTLESLSTDEAKASEMEHALRFEIRIKREENPVFYDSLREKLEGLIEKRKAHRVEMANFLTNLEALTEEAQAVPNTARAMGFNKFEFGIYGILDKDGLKPDDLKMLTKKIFKELDECLVIDWPSKDDNQREARRLVKRNLRANRCPDDQLDRLTSQIMDLTRVHLKR